MKFRPATPSEDPTIAEHFCQMWQDIGIPAEQIKPEWEALTMDFIAEARAHLDFQAFVAEATDGRLIGSASCQQFAGLYPRILKPSQKLRGYIWGVYVESEYRRQGIGRRLTARAVDHLRDIGCTHAILHAAPMGQSVYSGIGFESANQMTLDLTKSSKLEPSA